MITRRSATAAFLSLMLAGGALAMDIKDPENTLIMQLKDGEVIIELLPALAPNHVARVKELVRAGDYDNVAFHRVIPDFMAQTGDVEFGDMEDGFDQRRAGTGGSSQPDLKAEFSREPFVRGTLGMARSQNPDSANSQFFICFDDASWLNGQYTVFGQVIDGMDHVDAIKSGSRQNNGAIEGDPDRILSLKVAADAD